MTGKPRSSPARALSLCARAVPEISPVEVITVAMDTGYEAVGFAFDDMAELDRPLAHKLRKRIDDSPLFALDIDVIRVWPGPLAAADFHFLDCAAEIGVQHVLVVSQDPDFDQTTEKFSVLCDHAAGVGLGIVFEFLMITDYRTLDDAFVIVNGANRANGKILIDTLHLARAGHKPGDIASFDPALFPYVQLCDGAAEVDLNDFEALVLDAREGRFSPGEGALPLGEMLSYIAADTALSIEVRSLDLNQRFPDPVERARHLNLACKKLLESLP